MKCKANSQCSINSDIFPSTAQYFKEELVTEMLSIPTQKPDMERILNVLVDPKIVSTRLVQTEEGYSNEGQRLAGYKLVVELNIREKVTYVADEETQSVHAAHFEKMKSIFIVLPKEINGVPTCDLFRADRIMVTPYIEAVKTRMLDARTIYKCMLLFVDITIC